jgi:hypothetical protein
LVGSQLPPDAELLVVLAAVVVAVVPLDAATVVPLEAATVVVPLDATAVVAPTDAVPVVLDELVAPPTPVGPVTTLLPQAASVKAPAR